MDRCIELMNQKSASVVLIITTRANLTSQLEEHTYILDCFQIDIR